MRALNVVALLMLGCVSFASTAEAAGKRSAKSHVVGVLNLNAATVNQLDLLPGVGEKAAKRIVEFRTKTPFARTEELVKVKGFGKKRFEKLKPFLAVAGPTTLKKLAGPPTTEGAEKPDLPPAQGRMGKPAKR